MKKVADLVRTTFVFVILGSVGASKLAALQEEYEEKFESQTPACMRGAADVGTTKKHCGLRSQQLQVALQNKERIEKEKQEAGIACGTLLHVRLRPFCCRP